MRRASTLILLAVTLALGACDQPRPDLGPLELMPVQAPGPRPAVSEDAPRVVHHWQLGKARGQLPEGWSVLSGETTLEHIPLGTANATSGREMLVFEDVLTLRMRGRFEPQDFNQAVVSLEILTSRDTFDIGIRGLRSGRKDFETVKTVQADRGAKTIVFDLGQLLREEQRYGQVVLFARGVGRIGIRSVDLVHKPVASWLPQASDPQPVLMGDEARPAFALTSHSPVTADFVGGRDLRMSFACARPPFVSRLGEEPRLAVTLRTAEALLTHQELTLFEDEESGWLDFSLAFDVEPGEPVEVRFELLPGSGEGEPSAADAEVYCALTPPVIWQPVEAPPTVVLVTVDTHRADHVGGARHAVGVETPFLDELAARGVFFEDCYASVNITIPSHATLLTGLTPRDTGVVTNTAGLAPAAATLAEAFAAEGYATFAATSVGHLRDDPSGLAQGFERFIAPERNDVPADVTIGRLAEWLPHAEGRPLFVWLHLFDVHAPYRPPEELLARYWPADRDPYDPQLPALSDDQRTSWDPDLRDAEYNAARYKGEVSFLDARLREAFELPRLADAIVAVTSDHGEAFGQHGYWFNHSNLYPATADVPLVIAWPGAEGGVRIAAPVRQLDIGRTLLDLAGLEQHPFPGRDLLGPEGPSPQRFGLSSGAHSATLSEGQWFAAFYLRSLPMPGTEERMQVHRLELFDLAADRDCMHDVADEHPEVAGRMRALIVHWLQSRVQGSLAESPGEQDAGRLAELAALGYATDAAPTESELFDSECACEYCQRYQR